MFYRLHTDGTPHPAALENLFAGPTRTACWIIGGGPSLARLPADRIAASCLPKFAVNLAGSGLIRPNFWTSYDPTARFHRSIYLDPGIIKFLHRCRAMDVIPETTFKVCEAPATFFFDRDRQRGFADFLSLNHTAIVDWQDSLLQAVDIAYRLGFRTLYLAGCDMFLRPSPVHLKRARQQDVHYTPGELLRDFFSRCRQAGISDEELAASPLPHQYHFDEAKPFAAAVHTDEHYFRVAQYLRLSRRALALAGMELISVTPMSRLNDYFASRPIDEVLKEIGGSVGDPAGESTRGRYHNNLDRRPQGLGPMRDFRPHFWNHAQSARPAQPAVPPVRHPARRDPPTPEIEIPINELG